MVPAHRKRCVQWVCIRDMLSGCVFSLSLTCVSVEVCFALYVDVLGEKVGVSWLGCGVSMSVK